MDDVEGTSVSPVLCKSRSSTAAKTRQSIHKAVEGTYESPQKKQRIAPTMKLIDFQKKRYKNKVETARKLTPQRSFERLLVYSNKPKLNLETSLRRLEMIKTDGIEKCNEKTKSCSRKKESVNKSKNFIEKNKEDAKGTNKRPIESKKYHKKPLKKVSRLEDQIEESLARELLPALEETVAKM